MLEGLNEQQRQAVSAEDGPLLVLAGAGSGKTRVIIHKIAYAVRVLHQDPAGILAVTFTNKAADEMRQRLSGMIDPHQASRAVIRTFHSFGAWVLRRYGDRLGLSRDFVIYDDEDSLSLLHTLYPAQKRKDLSPYMRAISRLKDRGLSPNDDISDYSKDPKLPEMYRRYQRRLREIGNVDFGDLIARVIELFRANPDILAEFRRRFRTVLVDEYQDTNAAQFELLKLLYEPGMHLCVVGDDDQSIYRFRGAEVENILKFPDLFPGTQVVALEQNYRSTGHILALASSVVSRNRSRHRKTLWGDKPMGKPAQLFFVNDHMAEAELGARLVRQWGAFDGTAILYRTNAQSAAFETVFLREQIPYKIVGALRFYEREEIKDALALLALAVNPADEIAFRRMINKPSRGVGKTSLEKLLSNRRDNLLTSCREAPSVLTGRAAAGAETFADWLEESRRSLGRQDLPGWITDVLTRSGIIAYHRKQDEVASTQKEQNLEELVNASAAYPGGLEGLRAFLESMELDRARVGRKDPSEEHGVTLITMHNTKGLEFPRVIITGLEEGLFPSRPRGSDQEIEEERRIFYVSITRCMEELCLTSCRRRFLWGRSSVQMPSRFLQELDEEHVTVVGAEPARRPAAPSAGRSREPGQFSPGERIYHDAYGSGFITASWKEDGREVVTVQFETGRTCRFLPEYAPLEKVAQD